MEIIASGPENLDNTLNFYTNGVHNKNLKKFKGVTLHKHYRGKTIKNNFGECYLISEKVECENKEIGYKKIKHKFFSDLKVITGIKNITEENLKGQGIKSIPELTQHPRYGKSASLYLKLIENAKGRDIYKYLSKRLASSHSLLLLNSLFFDLSEIVFVDIETLGLYGCPLFLIGIASFKNEKLMINQILCKKTNEEKAALHYLRDCLRNKEAICSFNGKSFDIPFINLRMFHHNLKFKTQHPHFDILHFSRNAFKNYALADYRLTSLEASLFNIGRKDDVPSYLIPKIYTSYLESNNIGYIIPIIEHNRQDLITTANLFMKLHEFWSK